MKLPTKKAKPVKDFKSYITQIYGRWKIGKTTFVSQFPDILMCMTEPGAKSLEVYGGDHVYNEWADLKDTLRQLIVDKHDFKWVAIDTIDKAWKMCERHFLKKFGIEHEQDIKYGKVYQMITREFENVFDALTSKGIGVIFVSHCAQYTEIHKGVERIIISNSIKKEEIRNYINGKCDFNFFFEIDSNEQRYIQTKSTHNVTAGDRTGMLPEKIEVITPEKGFENLMSAFKNAGWTI